MRRLLAVCPIEFECRCIFQQHGCNLDVIGNDTGKDEVIGRMRVVVSTVMVVVIMVMRVTVCVVVMRMVMIVWV